MFSPFTHIPPHADDPHGPSDTYVNTMYEDRTGTLWVGTGGEGLYRMTTRDRETGRLVPFVCDSGNALNRENRLINSVLEDREGYIWIASYGGLYRYDPQQDSVFHYGLHDIDDTKNLTGDWINVVREDSNGMLWIGTNGQGMCRFDPSTGSFHRLYPFLDVPGGGAGYPVLSLYEDRSGIFWFGTNGYGILKMNPKAKQFTSYTQIPGNDRSLAVNSVRALYEDPDGSIWIGGYFGLDRFDSATGSFVHYGHLPMNQCVYTIREDPADPGRMLWIGTEGQGLFKFDRLQGKLVAYEGTSELSGTSPAILIFSMHADESGRLWIGTQHGLNRFDPLTGENRVFAHDDRNPHSMSEWPVQAICRDRTGCLWFGTDQDGLFRLTKEDRTTGRFTHLKHDPGDANTLSNDHILCTTEDDEGNLWVGLSDGGLNRLVLSSEGPPAGRGIEKVERYTMADGLPDNTVCGIVEDGRGFLWISTQGGLSRFDPEARTFRNYDADDGLPSNIFNSSAFHRGRSGIIYFGTNNGFVSFRPDSIRDNTYVPPVVITAFRKFNETVPLGTMLAGEGELRLSHKDYVISFEFAALNFAAPMKNRYSYMLEGFAELWTYTNAKKRFATYTNLDPGRYTFRVRGSNNDGLWNEEGIALAVLVTPPYWGTWWFRTMVIVSISGAVGFLYWSRIRGLKNRQAVQERFSQQLIESQEQERKRIASELHDSLGQDLLAIKNRAALGSQASRNNRKAEEQFHEISLAADQALKDAKEISLNLRPYQLDRLGLTEAVRSMINSVEDASEIFFESEIDNIDFLLLNEKEINIFRILQEGLNNVLKHSGAGRAGLIVKRDQHNIQISIEDDGRGFKVDAVTGSRSDGRGFGLESMRERVEILRGKWKIDSAPGKGTRIHIEIPIGSREGREGTRR